MKYLKQYLNIRRCNTIGYLVLSVLKDARIRNQKYTTRHCGLTLL